MKVDKNIVVKHNDMIQKSRFELSVTEQRALAYIISMIEISSENNFQLEYQFDIRKYAKTCGLVCDTGRIYEETKSLLTLLKSKVWWIEKEDGWETAVSWLSRVSTNKRSGVAKIKIDEELAPYVFNLKKKFTQYGLENILAFKSQYSIRIYELMKSYEWHGDEVTYEIDVLKKRLNVHEIKSYENYKDFRVKVLDTAISEINEYTDIHVTYEPIKKGRKVEKIIFSISQKEQPFPAENEIAVTEILDADDQVTWDDYSSDGVPSRDIFSEHLEFLSEACENKFSIERMKVLHSLITNGKIPFSLGNIQLEQFHFLRTCYLKMQAAGTETKIKNKFSYLQQVIKNEFIKPELNYSNHAESQKQYIQKKSKFNNFSAEPMDHDLIENLSLQMIIENVK